VRLAAAALLLLSGPALAQQRERTDAPVISAYKIVLVGDSTMAPGSGWASAFCAYNVKSSVACLNLGRGGRSTRSYRAEGSWAIALAEASVRGYGARYVLIQMGHNDQSSKPERWTDLRTEFPANLRTFVTELRAVGAIPVLVTPLTRRSFRDGRLQNDLVDHAAAVRAVAAELRVPLVDLNRSSAAAVERLGAVAAADMAQAPPNEAERAALARGTTLPPREAEEARLPDVPTTPTGPRGQIVRKFDYTHLGDAGARATARLVAADLAAAVPALRSQLLP
jgi:lysophospholipase L1-like esterase